MTDGVELDSMKAFKVSEVKLVKSFLPSSNFFKITTEFSEALWEVLHSSEGQWKNDTSSKPLAVNS